MVVLMSSLLGWSFYIFFGAIGTKWRVMWKDFKSPQQWRKSVYKRREKMEKYG